MVIIYLLRLAKSKYYVGKTTDIVKRINQHMDGTSSINNKWIRTYPMADGYYILQCNADDFAEQDETIKAMKKYGIDNVRGGIYSQFELTPFDIQTINKQFANATDSCFKCGFVGHFAKNCENNKDKVNNVTSISISSYIDAIDSQFNKYNIGKSPDQLYTECVTFFTDFIKECLLTPETYIRKDQITTSSLSYEIITYHLKHVNEWLTIARHSGLYNKLPSDLSESLTSVSDIVFTVNAINTSSIHLTVQRKFTH